MNQITRIKNFCCPSCGGHIGEAAPLDEQLTARLSPSQRAIFALLAKKPGAPIPNERIVAALYDHRPDGGPDAAKEVAVQLVYQTKKRIEPYGWTIVSHGGGRGNTSTYRLIPIHAGA